jgi:glycosyltransferase involved in cell wall biosynthesis
LQKSDYSIIARKSNKLTEYGFSSKICEAFAYGIPVIATNNSDNKIYIKDGINGYVCDSNYESLRSLLSAVDGVEKSVVLKMHDYMLENNPLSVKNYIEKFSVFVNNLFMYGL